ncbi:MAG: hypothetical protein ACRC41_01610 [Sarcina sp.]
MNTLGFKEKISNLLNNLFIIFVSGGIAVIYTLVCLFLNLKQIQMLNLLAILISLGLTIFSIATIIKNKGNRKSHNILFFLTNLLLLSYFTLSPIIIKKYYEYKDTTLPFLHVYQDESIMNYRKSLDKLEYKDVVIYHGGLDNKSLNDIKNCIDLAIERSKDIYGDLGHEKLNLILHPDMEQFLAGNNGAPASGYFSTLDKTLNIPFNKGDIVTEEFKTVFLHEYNHYMIDKLKIKHNIELEGIPAWFDEGFSEFFAFGNQYSNVFFEFISYEKLKSMNAWSETLSQGYNPYAQSHYTLCYIAQQKGIQGIIDIIVNSSKLGFEKSVENTMGMPLNEFLENARKKIQAKFFIDDANLIK